MGNLELQGLSDDDNAEVLRVGSAFASITREFSVPTPLGIVLSSASRSSNKVYAYSMRLQVLYCTA